MVPVDYTDSEIKRFSITTYGSIKIQQYVFNYLKNIILKQIFRQCTDITISSNVAT